MFSLILQIKIRPNTHWLFLLQSASRGRWDLTNPGLLLLNHMSFHLLTSPAHSTCWVWSKKIAAAWDCEPDRGMITNLTQDCFQLKLSLGAGWRYRQEVSTFQKHYFHNNPITFCTISPCYFTHSDTIKWFGCWNKCRKFFVYTFTNDSNLPEV